MNFFIIPFEHNKCKSEEIGKWKKIEKTLWKYQSFPYRVVWSKTAGWYRLFWFDVSHEFPENSCNFKNIRKRVVIAIMGIIRIETKMSLVDMMILMEIMGKARYFILVQTVRRSALCMFLSSRSPMRITLESNDFLR